MLTEIKCQIDSMLVNYFWLPQLHFNWIYLTFLHFGSLCLKFLFLDEIKY